MSHLEYREHLHSLPETPWSIQEPFSIFDISIACKGKLSTLQLPVEPRVLDVSKIPVQMENILLVNAVYTRMIEHKHFESGTQPKIIVVTKNTQ